MAHQIENDMMAYRSDVPWHGLGVRVGDGLDTLTRNERVMAWLDAAGMNWRVQRRRLAMRGKDGDGLLTEPLQGHMAIVRADTDHVFQVAKSRYQPFQNEEIIGFFQEYCEAGEAQIETLGALNNGGKVWCLAKLRNGDGRYDVGQDKANGYLLLASSHDGTLQTVGKTTMIYVVCYNTMSAALNLKGGKLGKKESGEFRFKHSRKFTSAVADEAKQTMGMAIQQAQETTSIARQLSLVQVDDKGRTEFVNRLLKGESLLDQVAANTQPAKFDLDSVIAASQYQGEDEEPDTKRLGKALIEAMISSPGSDLQERKGTMWGAVNGVTYYVDHERGRTRDTALTSAWFGQGDILKKQAVKLAVEMAGI